MSAGLGRNDMLSPYVVTVSLVDHASASMAGEENSDHASMSVNGEGESCDPEVNRSQKFCRGCRHWEQRRSRFHSPSVPSRVDVFIGSKLAIEREQGGSSAGYFARPYGLATLTLHHHTTVKNTYRHRHRHYVLIVLRCYTCPPLPITLPFHYVIHHNPL